MRKPLRLPVVVINLMLLVGLVAIWIAFAPMLVGGLASYVVVNGNSMEPGFHRGDLAIVQAASIYNVGDIVTYRNAQLKAFVIHRIIAIEQDHYVFKGDNNSWIDPYRPTRDELIGKLWIHVPKLGKAMEWLHIPINMGLTTGLLGGILMASIIIKPKQHGKGKNKPTGNFGGMLEGGLYLLGIFALAFLGLSIFAFVHPLTRSADNVQYQQDSNFFYSATGTPGVYDTELVRSGEPVFPKLTCFLNIGFTYSVLGDQLQEISGSHQLFARVMDEQSGWQRTIPMNPEIAFSGNSFFTMGILDLCHVESLVNLMEEETGLHANTYSLEIVTQVAMTSKVAGNQINDSFSPSLVFKFDKVHFYLAGNNTKENPLHLSKPGLAGNTSLQANTISLLGWKPAVATVRVFSLLGLGLSLGGLFIVGLYVFYTARGSQEALIRLRYGALLVDVYGRSIEPTSTLIDVTTIDDLAKLAERHNTMILHMTLNFLHYYLVQSNGTTYRYMISTGKNGIAETESARQEVFGYVLSNDEYGLGEIQPSRQELPAYVVNMDRINAEKVDFAQTEILRKIKF